MYSTDWIELNDLVALLVVHRSPEYFMRQRKDLGSGLGLAPSDFGRFQWFKSDAAHDYITQCETCLGIRDVASLGETEHFGYR